MRGLARASCAPGPVGTRLLRLLRGWRALAGGLSTDGSVLYGACDLAGSARMRNAMLHKNFLGRS